jgi:UDP-N-acetylmuramoyl-L-alanyl-D-glutamate--2,6-diaminopimelate ligase
MGDPASEMFTVAVTGTNGKSSTALLIRHLLSPDLPTGMIGTFGLFDEEGLRPGTEGLTTPDPVQLASWMRDLADRGVRAVVVEASSHALDQNRLDGIEFDVGVLTNLTQDHLDYHETMESYRTAKLRLVDLVSGDGDLVVNAGDAAWDGLQGGARTVRLYAAATADVDRVSNRGPVHLLASFIGPAEVGSGSRAGTTFGLVVDGDVENTTTVQTPYRGRFNVENTLAAIATALIAGVSLERIVERLADAPVIPGRLEQVFDRFDVLIDFAHTPGALEATLSALRPTVPGKLIVVVGAGGDRDATKRAEMGEVAGRLADVVVLTSDNPRTEDPEAILDDVAEGLKGADFYRITDRRDAIRKALSLAESREDTVLLAGKGHETYQVRGTEKVPFDEREIAREVARDLWWFEESA